MEIILNSEITYTIIDSPAHISENIKKLEKSDSIAIDTEFIRERTYYPIPALIQISNGSENLLFDPIRCDLEKLYQYLGESDQQKIFHAASQDIEIFELVMPGKPLKNVIDTQIAAFFLGNTNCLGLANILEDYLEVHLEKTETVSKWAQRPLTHKQLTYATEDVYYLHELFSDLKKKLKEQNKLKYFTEECTTLTTIKPPLENLKRKHLKFTDSPYYREVLTDLILWRENYAQKRNIPRTWVLKDAQIKKIAYQNNPSIWEYKKILEPKQLHRYATTFSEIHEKHSDLSTKKNTFSEKDRSLQEKLMARIRKLLNRISEKHQIPVEFICNQKQMQLFSEIFVSTKEIPSFKGWRGDLCNHPLTQIVVDFN